jgi:hypothetical protein
MNTLLIAQNQSNPQTKDTDIWPSLVLRLSPASFHYTDTLIQAVDETFTSNKSSRSFRDIPLRSAGLCLLSD